MMPTITELYENSRASGEIADVRRSQPMKPNLPIRIGTAGWNISGVSKAGFPLAGSHLESYANVFNAVEINSSFHRPHKFSTYQRWAASVSETFRFAAKIPKEITHFRRLSDVEPLLDVFLASVAGLESKLGPFLIQLPPSFAFGSAIAEKFFANMRDRVAGPIALEPRNVSWFTREVEALLMDYRIARLAADPAPVPDVRQPGGWPGLKYCRLHGSPRMYYSSYSDKSVGDAVDALAVSAGEGSECWCIFDNTAAGAATENALIAKEIAVRRA